MAPAISFGGIASGLDTQSIIATLSAINQRPIGLLEQKKAEFNSLKKRYEELEKKLETLQTKARDLAKSKDFLAFEAKSSSESVLSATANGSAGAGAFNVTVNTLARSQVSASTGYADITTTSAGTGDIKITIGGTQHTVSVASGSDTLEEIRDAINDKDLGVTATIVSSGSGATPYQIVLQSDKTGTDNAFTVDMTSFTGSLAFSTKQAADNATLSINGMSFTRQNNTISDVVPGVTMNLVSTSATPVSVSVTTDYDKIQKRVQEYVDAHSDVVNFINTNIKAVNDKGGPFNGESTVRNIKKRILDAISDGAYPGGSLKSLASIGVKLQNDGTLTFDSAKFESAAEKSLDDVTKLMTKVGSFFDKAGLTLTTKPPNLAGGSYAVAITQVATKASGTAGATFAAGSTLGAAEKLTFTVAGKSFDVNLAANDTLAQALTKINAEFDARDIAIDAKDDAGSIKLDAWAFGSKQSFSVVSDVAAGATSSGIGTTGFSGTGLDVAGTIGGLALVGDGQKLKGDASSVYKGLEFQYSGTAPTTSTLTLGSDGFFVKLEDMLDTFLAAVSGPIAARVDGLGDRMEDIDDRIGALETRAQRWEEVMRQKFTALEQIMGRFQAQQNFLATFTFPSPQ